MHASRTGAGCDKKARCARVELSWPWSKGGGRRTPWRTRGGRVRGQAWFWGGLGLERDMKLHRLSIARSGIFRSATAIGTTLMAASVAGQVWAADLVGQPTDGAIGFQPGVTELRHRVEWFHSWILLPVLFGISALILGLLLWCIIRFNAKANPDPGALHPQHPGRGALDRGSGADPAGDRDLLVPAAVRLPRHAPPDMTVKATGYQWYWGYAYPDQKIDPNRPRGSSPKDQAEGRRRALHVGHYPADDRAGQQGGPGADHRRRRDPLLRGAGLRHQDRRGARPLNETWFKATKTGTLLRPVLAAVRQGPRLHADRGEGGQPGRLRRLGRQPEEICVQPGELQRLGPRPRASGAAPPKAAPAKS
jgi:hypothetical protein